MTAARRANYQANRNSPFELEIVASKEWDELQRKLKGAPKELRRELNANIRKATAPVVSKMKTTLADVKAPTTEVGGQAFEAGVTGGGGGGNQRRRIAVERATTAKHRERIRAKTEGFGLRATIARSIQTKITTSGWSSGVRIRVDSAQLGHQARALPKYLDGMVDNQHARWRHPVFGNPELWAQQTPTPKGWFTLPVRAATPIVRAAVVKAMNDTNDKL